MTPLEVTLDGSTIDIRRGDELVLRGWAEARLADGRIISTRDGEVSELSVAVHSPSPGTGEIVLTLRNSGTETVWVEQLLPLVTESALGSQPERLRVGEMGWQSWSRPRPLQAFRPDGLPIDLVRDPIASRRLPDSEVSPWMALLGTGRGEPLLVGFTRAVDFSGVIEVGRDRLQAWCDVEGLALAPGRTISSEPLLVACGPEAELMNHYASTAASHMGARSWLRVPTGWCSWYHFYTGVTEDDLRQNLSALARLRAKLPIEVFQLDDGYQREVGDWLTLNDKFPSGMPALVALIRGHGFTPGIWLAPFLLSARSQTYAQHPDWAVRADDGSPLSVVGNWDSDNYALDTTNPEALEWVEHVVRSMCTDWGYDYLKIDFIYAAAVRGLRHDSGTTAIQAYRRGLERIRAVAGDRFILGCGAPFLPSVGMVDGMRIGEDVAPFWRRPNNEAGPAMTNALHATLLHNWMHRRWWINDPDCVMVRAHDSELTLTEVRAWAGVVALSGGMVLVSDDLASLEPDRVELLSRLFPPLGEPSDALGPYTDEIPERLWLTVERPWGNWWIVGLANWSDRERPAVFAPAAWGLPAGAYHLVDLWSGTHQGPLSGDVELRPLDPHELYLLSVHPDAGRPQVVGSTGHLLGEAMDLLEERWDGLTLTVQMAGPRSHQGELLVYVPDEFETEQPVPNRLLRLPFDLARPEELLLRFRPVQR